MTLVISVPLRGQPSPAGMSAPQGQDSGLDVLPAVCPRLAQCLVNICDVSQDYWLFMWPHALFLSLLPRLLSHEPVFMGTEVDTGCNFIYLLKNSIKNEQAQKATVTT